MSSAYSALSTGSRSRVHATPDASHRNPIDLSGREPTAGLMSSVGEGVGSVAAFGDKYGRKAARAAGLKVNEKAASWADRMYQMAWVVNACLGLGVTFGLHNPHTYRITIRYLESYAYFYGATDTSQCFQNKDIDVTTGGLTCWSNMTTSATPITWYASDMLASCIYIPIFVPLAALAVSAMANSEMKSLITALGTLSFMQTVCITLQSLLITNILGMRNTAEGLLMAGCTVALGWMSHSSSYVITADTTKYSEDSLTFYLQKFWKLVRLCGSVQTCVFILKWTAIGTMWGRTQFLTNGTDRLLGRLPHYASVSLWFLFAWEAFVCVMPVLDWLAGTTGVIVGDLGRIGSEAGSQTVDMEEKSVHAGAPGVIVEQLVGETWSWLHFSRGWLFVAMNLTITTLLLCVFAGSDSASSGLLTPVT